MARTRSTPQRLVFAVTEAGCADANGLTYQLVTGQVWAADDPLVAKNPGLFSEEPPFPYPLRSG